MMFAYWDIHWEPLQVFSSKDKIAAFVTIKHIFSLHRIAVGRRQQMDQLHPY